MADIPRNLGLSTSVAIVMPVLMKRVIWIDKYKLPLSQHSSFEEGTHPEPSKGLTVLLEKSFLCPYQLWHQLKYYYPARRKGSRAILQPKH